MRRFSSIVLVALALVLGAASPSYAAVGHGGPGFSGHSAGGHFDGNQGFEGHHGFDGGHAFHHGGHGGVFIGAPFYWAPGYPTYWYFCPSYGAYYPTVPSCPEAWVPVLA